MYLEQRLSNYIWVINDYIAYKGVVAFIRGLMVINFCHVTLFQYARKHKHNKVITEVNLLNIWYRNRIEQWVNKIPC